MPNIVHPILGAIDPSVPGFWDTAITFDGRTVTFDLTVDGSDLASAELNNLPRKVEELEPLDRAARIAILQDARSGDDDSAAKLYITHHHDVLPRPDFARLFGTDTPDLAQPDALLSRLVLVRVGLYPENEDQPFLLDYSIDPDVTNYLLSVSFDSNRQPLAVDLES
jgi:hypothetical protein